MMIITKAIVDFNYSLFRCLSNYVVGTAATPTITSKINKIKNNTKLFM